MRVGACVRACVSVSECVLIQAGNDTTASHLLQATGMFT